MKYARLCDNYVITETAVAPPGGEPQKLWNIKQLKFSIFFIIYQGTLKHGFLPNHRYHYLLNN